MGIEEELQESADHARAALLARYFKTGKGQYAEGDVFLGLTLPQLRAIVKRHQELPLSTLGALLSSPKHEFRLASLLILVHQFEKGDAKKQREIVQFYLKHTKGINNWDLVDLSAPRILGAYLVDKDREVLFKLVKSDSIWERRIAILATFAFIKQGKLGTSLRIADILMSDKHDLIHKALGWMLREVGKQDEAVLKKYLTDHIEQLPRTSLRYAIERMTPKERQHFMSLGK